MFGNKRHFAHGSNVHSIHSGLDVSYISNEICLLLAMYLSLVTKTSVLLTIHSIQPHVLHFVSFVF